MQETTQSPTSTVDDGAGPAAQSRAGGRRRLLVAGLVVGGVVLAGAAAALAWPRPVAEVGPSPAEVLPVLARAATAQDAPPEDLQTYETGVAPESDLLVPESARLLAELEDGGGVWAASTESGRVCALFRTQTSSGGSACAAPLDLENGETVSASAGGGPSVTVFLTPRGTPAPDDDFREVSPGVWVNESALAD